MAMYYSVSEQVSEKQREQAINNRLTILKEVLGRCRNKFLNSFIYKCHTIVNSGLITRRGRVDYRPDIEYFNNKVKKSEIKAIKISSAISDILDGSRVLPPTISILESDIDLNNFIETIEGFLKKIPYLNEEIQMKFQNLLKRKSVAHEIVAEESFLALSDCVDKMNYILVDYDIIKCSSLPDINLKDQKKFLKEILDEFYFEREISKEVLGKFSFQQQDIVSEYEKDLKSKFLEYRSLLIDLYEKYALDFVNHREKAKEDKLSSVISLKKSREIVKAIDDVLAKKIYIFNNMTFSQVQKAYVSFNNPIQNCIDEVNKRAELDSCLDLFALPGVYNSISSIHSAFKFFGLIDNRIETI